ncbi:hypothetical protein MPLB_2160003 [Mesorhizobium sp. ORS 3324]|nr:hypothetical protein MPLB_2160003 [Mesorhizobium sp. ORS 3324]
MLSKTSKPDRLARVSQTFWVKLRPTNLVERFKDESSAISHINVAGIVPDVSLGSATRAGP